MKSIIYADSFPEGLDYAWLAVDAEGHIGIFTNAGIGPIPTAILADRATSDRAETLVWELPEHGECRMLVALPRPDDFIGFARRGLFAYDWRDVHRATGRSHHYELLSQPESPVSLEEMNSKAAALARRARFGSLRFAESLRIAVTEHMECYPKF